MSNKKDWNPKYGETARAVTPLWTMQSTVRGTQLKIRVYLNPFTKDPNLAWAIGVHLASPLREQQDRLLRAMGQVPADHGNHRPDEGDSYFFYDRMEPDRIVHLFANSASKKDWEAEAAPILEKAKNLWEISQQAVWP